MKDVIFKEDTSPIYGHQPAINISIEKTIAINLIRLIGSLLVTEAQRWLNSNCFKVLVLFK